MWSQNFESVNVNDEGAKFNPSCYNLEDTVERNIIRLMRYGRKDFPNYRIIDQRIDSFTALIAVKKESELSQNLATSYDLINVYNVSPEILPGYNYCDLREFECKFPWKIKEFFKDDEENYIILGSKHFLPVKEERV